jgi:hypothetical protein
VGHKGVKLKVESDKNDPSRKPCFPVRNNLKKERVQTSKDSSPLSRQIQKIP